MTNCKPCGRNKYWVNATHCEDCPAGYITDVLNGVPDITGCKGTVINVLRFNTDLFNCTYFLKSKRPFEIPLTTWILNKTNQSVSTFFSFICVLY